MAYDKKKSIRGGKGLLGTMNSAARRGDALDRNGIIENKGKKPAAFKKMKAGMDKKKKK